MGEVIGVFGAGGCGRGVMPLIRSQFMEVDPENQLFVDDELAGSVTNGHRVCSLREFASMNVARKRIVVAVANSIVRRKLVDRCTAAGLEFLTVRARSALEMDDVSLGEGSIISPYVSLTSNITIGCHFHANLYSYVEHDCRIGDFVTFGPNVHCNGNVIIEDGAYIGAGALIRQGTADRPLFIGRSAVVGMGAVVIGDVPAGEIVVGNPARPLKHG